MKLIWLSHFVPYPPRGGSRQRSYNLIRYISTKFETHLVALNIQRETKARVEEYAAELRKFCASVEIWQPPYPWRGARWWAQLALSPFYREHYGACALWSPDLGRRWAAVLSRHDGALVHFDSLDLARYLPPAAGFHKILNHHNCESAMAARRAQKEPNPAAKLYLWHQARKLRRLEQQVCHQFDVNLAVSQLDGETLQAIDPQAHFHVVENGTDTEYFHPSDAEPEANTLVFAGSLDWSPNVTGIRFFAREIWPALKQQRPGLRLTLAGRNPAAEIVRLAKSDPAIELIADTPDIRPCVWKAAVFVCPIIDGGGTRLKILDALAMGKAVVTTTVGSEGLALGNNRGVLIADSAEDFTAQTARILADGELRARLAESGRAIVERSYSWPTVCSQLQQAYSYALGAVTQPLTGREAAGGQRVENAGRLPRFSLVVPVLNSKATLGPCLESVKQAVRKYPDSEVIVMDHGSTDGSLEWLTTECGEWAKVVQERGGTIASLRNKGARRATGEFVCFLDSDCTIGPDYLSTALAVFDQVDTDATGCRCRIPSAPHWVEETWHNLHRTMGVKDGYVRFINSGNLVVRKSSFDRVGGFDERLQTDEDSDLVQRLWASGFKVYEARAVWAVHHGNPKSLLGFLKNEMWRGTGLASARKRAYTDKILLATVAHCCLILAALAILPFLRMPLVVKLCAFAGALLAVPCVAVTFRYVSTRRVYRPARSVLLYLAYFSAKAAAILAGLGRGEHAARGKRTSRATAPNR